MNIALLHYAAPPIVGGVEAVVGEHARLMADAGHQVRIIAGRGEQVDPRVRFIRLPEVDSRHPDVLAVKQQLDVGRVPSAFDELASRIGQELREPLIGVDWLVAHNVCSLNKNLPLTAALNQVSASGVRPRLILWHHDLAWTTPRYADELHDGYPWDLLRADWPSAIQVVVSEWRRKELAELLGVPATRIRVVPNGVDVVRFLGLGAQTKALVRQIRLLDVAPLLLLPVRVTRRKNIEFALRVLAALRKSSPGAGLVITGPLGPHNAANVEYHEQLLELRRQLGLEAAAHFLTDLSGEPLPADVVAEFYRLADVLLLPSREEGFGIPILEAGLARTPIYCSDIDSLRELAGENAHYFSPDDDPDSVASEIESCLHASSGYGMRRRVIGGYSWERVYSDHIAPLLQEQ